MKKFLAVILSLTAATAFAGSATVEYTDAKGVDGGGNSGQYLLQFKENVTKNVAVDVKMTTQQADGTKAVTSRVEGGVTGSVALAPSLPFSVYTRVGLGQKYKAGQDFTYYTVEPGVQAPVGPFMAKVGYQYRAATDSAIADTTKMWRAGLTYPLTRVDAVGVRYDRMRGDTNANSWNLAYTRNF
jgi:hypothetical protein